MEDRVKKYVAECIGTFILVFVGCGAAHFIDEYLIMGIVGVSLAFGLTLLALSFAIGPISGCHINPAVSLAFWIKGKLSLADMLGYWVAQIIGAMLSIISLGAILGNGLNIGTYSVYACNDTINLPNAPTGLIVEIILTFIFVFSLLGANSKDDGKHTGFAAGIALIVVHIIGINLTGTSVNPARSLAPALYNGELLDLWVFIIGPLAGAALAAFASKWMHADPGVLKAPVGKRTR